MKPDPSSAALVPRFLRVSSIGLGVSLAALILGEVIGRTVRGVTAPEIAGRVLGAALRGFGLGGTFVFLLLVASALLFKFLARITSHRTGG
jgi:hypothetical protein